MLEISSWKDNRNVVRSTSDLWLTEDQEEKETASSPLREALEEDNGDGSTASRNQYGRHEDGAIGA